MTTNLHLFFGATLIGGFIGCLCGVLLLHYKGPAYAAEHTFSFIFTFFGLAVGAAFAALLFNFIANMKP